MTLNKKCLSFIYSTGWRDSILSLPKKWLSVSGATDDFGFPEVSTYYTIKTFKIVWRKVSTQCRFGCCRFCVVIQLVWQLVTMSSDATLIPLWFRLIDRLSLIFVANVIRSCNRLKWMGLGTHQPDQ